MSGKNVVIFGLIFLIFVCFRRQRRHFVELCANAPSKSIKAAFQMSWFTIAASTIIPDDRLDLLTITTIATLFCAKAIFSSTIVGISLSICLFNYIYFDDLSFYEVYNSVVSIIFWKLSEDIREVITRLSFIWLFISPAINKMVDLCYH